MTSVPAAASTRRAFACHRLVRERRLRGQVAAWYVLVVSVSLDVSGVSGSATAVQNAPLERPQCRRETPLEVRRYRQPLALRLCGPGRFRLIVSVRRCDCRRAATRYWMRIVDSSNEIAGGCNGEIVG
jgi:hypothetical protein